MAETLAPQPSWGCERPDQPASPQWAGSRIVGMHVENRKGKKEKPRNCLTVAIVAGGTPYQ